MTSEPVLELRDVRKAFGGVRALRGVTLSIQAGQVHGLVGENGAGKSTLLKILAAVHPADDGAITLDGVAYMPEGTEGALRQGVVTVHQDINLIESLTIAENILLNNEPVSKLGLLRGREMRQRTAKLLALYGLELNPGMRVADLPNDVKKMIQIIKATTWNPRVLLLDEPTSSLTEPEVRSVLALIRQLAAQGVAVVFVSHYLAEILEVCDEVTVLRDGLVVSSGARAATDLARIGREMLGREMEQAARRGVREDSEVLFSVRDLSVRGSLRDISLDLHRGEILGVTGLTGAGLSELARAIFGSEDLHRRGGTFAIEGREVALAEPSDSLAQGLALLTHDRLREGILPNFSLLENLCLPILGRFVGRFGLLSRSGMTETTLRCIARLRVRAAGPSAAARTLSGGNQQKLLFAKWLETEPRIFLLDEPTIGIDVGSKFEIRRIIEDIAASGVGIILFSAELADIEALCDRVLVMFRGALVGEFAGAAMTRENILNASVSGRA